MTTLNQQNAQTCSLDIYVTISLWVFLYVSVYKGPSWGNHTKVMQHKTINFCTQLKWCKWVKWYLLNHSTVLTSVKYVSYLQGTGMYCTDYCTYCSAFQCYVYFVHLHIWNFFYVYILFSLMFLTFISSMSRCVTFIQLLCKEKSVSKSFIYQLMHNRFTLKEY